MLRRSAQADFYRALNKGPLRESDYDVSFTEKQLLVKFISDDFFFMADSVLDGNYVAIAMVPGLIAIREKQSPVPLPQLIGHFDAWSVRVAQDIAALPALREVERLQAHIRDFDARVGHIEDSYFTRDEAADFRHRLDLLEAQIRAQTQSQPGTDISIKSIESAFDTARKLSEAWKRSALLRFVFRRMSSEVAEFIQIDAGEIAKQLTGATTTQE